MHVNVDLRFIASRSFEAAQLFCQQASKSYGRGVLPVRTHNLNAHRQPGSCLTDGRNRSWATCKRSRGNPVDHVEVGPDAVRGNDGALVLPFAMVVRSSTLPVTKRYRTDRNKPVTAIGTRVVFCHCHSANEQSAAEAPTNQLLIPPVDWGFCELAKAARHCYLLAWGCNAERVGVQEKAVIIQQLHQEHWRQ